MLLLFPLLLCNVQCSGEVRKTANGYVKGFLDGTVLSQLQYVFRSVPYAEPPITGIDPYTQEFVDRRFKVCPASRFKFFRMNSSM